MNYTYITKQSEGSMVILFLHDDYVGGAMDAKHMPHDGERM